MKNVPQPLIDFLLSTDVESCFIADLFIITLASGLTIYATDGQATIGYNGNAYEPTRWGAWRCTGTELGLGLLNATASITVLADQTVQMPNWDIPLLEAVQLGLFDGAAITILTTFGLSYGETDNGVVIRYAGQITELTKTGRTKGEGECKPDTFTLNQQMPRQIMQPGCSWVFGDAGCTIDKATFTFTNTVGSMQGTSFITPGTAFSQADGYFTQGVVTFTSGRNTGLACFVQQHVNGQLRLTKPPLFPLKVGDTFTVVAGCDRTMQTCLQKFDNLLNYGGQPFIPNAETAIIA